MSGRGEPAGCHGDALKGGLCARLSCAAPARIPGPRPHPRPPAARSARFRSAQPVGPSTEQRAGAVPARALPPQGLGSTPGLGVGLGGLVLAGSVIWGARMHLVPPSTRLLE